MKMKMKRQGASSQLLRVMKLFSLTATLIGIGGLINGIAIMYEVRTY